MMALLLFHSKAFPKVFLQVIIIIIKQAIIIIKQAIIIMQVKMRVHLQMFTIINSTKFSFLCKIK